MKQNIKEKVLKETLKKFAPNSYEPLVRTIMKHPDTDAITYNQFCEALEVYSAEVCKVIISVKGKEKVGMSECCFKFSKELEKELGIK